MKALFAAALVLVTSPAAAQDKAALAAQDKAAPAAQDKAAPAAPPRLLVVISVDQFSADLFQQYRNHFTGGFARLLTGAVFPSGYQSHAATETCPGHSTILTGMRPARTGIVANNYVDQSAPRADKVVYCAEDETAPGSDHNSYTVSDKHLLVPTLGERMKTADPRTRTVSVAGKDRAAVMMGGHKVDQLWWWDGKRFATYAGRAEPGVVTRANAAVGALVAAGQAPLPLPGYCRPLDRPITVGTQTLGQGRFQRIAGDAKSFRASPPFDAAVFALAAGLIQGMNLGEGPAADIIAIGASATDYIGHAYGTQGTEMCIQMAELDRTLGDFLDQLDSFGVDYEVALTADHGGHDMTERQQQRAMPMESHVTADASAGTMGKAIAAQFGLKGPVLLAAEGDVYIDRALSASNRARVRAEAVRRYRALPQVAAVFTRDELAAAPAPSGPAETWSLLDRARASFNAGRSGDFIVLLKPRITSIETPAPGYVETHGSPWDYDRRVPILFWRRGMAGFEQPLSVETVDIAPTLAATIGFPLGGVDGRCLDLDPGPASTCPN